MGKSDSEGMTPAPQETPDPMPNEPDSEFIDGRHRVCLSDYYELQRYAERQSERLRATEARLEATERERKRAIDMTHKAEAALANSRDAALDEAAKEADAYVSDGNQYARHAGRAVARRIRALKLLAAAREGKE